MSNPAKGCDQVTKALESMTWFCHCGILSLQLTKHKPPPIVHQCFSAVHKYCDDDNDLLQHGTECIIPGPIHHDNDYNPTPGHDDDPVFSSDWLEQEIIMHFVGFDFEAARRGTREQR